MSERTIDPLTPILSETWDADRSWTLDAYVAGGGWQGLAKALAQPPADVVQVVKDSGLRGRGGAGFPTGMKWGFLPAPDGGPRYLVVNADESGAGDLQGHPAHAREPPAPDRGRGHHVVRDRVRPRVHLRARRGPARVPPPAASRRGGLRGRIPGQEHPGLGLRPRRHGPRGRGGVHLRRGDRAARLARGSARPAPPQAPVPAVAGLYARPTVVNNVESVASVPAIVNEGADWFKSMGTERSAGHGLFSLSGHVVRPGQYRRPSASRCASSSTWPAGSAAATA